MKRLSVKGTLKVRARQAVDDSILQISTSDGSLAPSSVMKSPINDINGIDWMAQQNGGQFDPILFGDYRDPQENILNNSTFGGYFNDAFLAQDFNSPFNTGDVIASPPPKRDLMKEIELQQNGTEDFLPHVVTKNNDPTQTLTCDKNLW